MKGVRRCCSQRVPGCISPRAQRRSHKRRLKSSRRRLERTVSSSSSSTWQTSPPSRQPPKRTSGRRLSSIRSITTGKELHTLTRRNTHLTRLKRGYVYTNRSRDDTRLRSAIWNERSRWSADQLLKSFITSSHTSNIQGTFISPSYLFPFSLRPQKRLLLELYALST
jgi:hypothetical protein